MDVVDPTPCLHDEYPTSDRLDLSRTSRQIFAETAHRYFETRLVFFQAALHEWLCIDELEPIAEELLTSSQKRSVKHVSLRWDDIGMDMRRGTLDLTVLKEFPHLRRITVPRMHRHAVDGLRDQICEILRGAAVGKQDLVVDFSFM